MNYLKQRSAPWVSFAVLAGGLLSAVILLWLVKFEAEISITLSNTGTGY